MKHHPSVMASCQQCGRRFCVNPSELARGNGKFCGPDCFYKSRKIPIENSFWKFVDKNGPIPSHVENLGACWQWTGAIQHGYGEIRSRRAHRFSWELHFGPVPSGLCVLHRCDNRKCCNPKHLFLGSKEENNSDRDAKGRQAKGEKSALAKLTESIIREIRSKYALGLSRMQIANEYSVGWTTANNIVLRRTWKHVV
jgi:hypothetical protein